MVIRLSYERKKGCSWYCFTIVIMLVVLEGNWRVSWFVTLSYYDHSSFVIVSFAIIDFLCTLLALCVKQI